MGIELIIVGIASAVVGAYWLYGGKQAKGQSSAHKSRTFEKGQSSAHKSRAFEDKSVIIVSDSETDYMKFSIDAIGRDVKDDRLWQHGTFVIAQDYIAIYSYDKEMPILHVPIDRLKGYFYVDRDNKPYQLWIHIESIMWYLLKFQFEHVQTRGGFRELRRVLDSVSEEGVQIGYQLEAPYIHLGTTIAQEVNSDDDGWILEDEVQLFLTPLYLVILDETGFYLYKLALSQVSDVQMIDIHNEKGIIHLTVDGTYQSFALHDYRRWAQLLSLAIDKIQEVEGT